MPTTRSSARKTSNRLATPAGPEFNRTRQKAFELRTFFVKEKPQELKDFVTYANENLGTAFQYGKSRATRTIFEELVDTLREVDNATFTKLMNIAKNKSYEPKDAIEAAQERAAQAATAQEASDAAGTAATFSSPLDVWGQPGGRLSPSQETGVTQVTTMKPIVTQSPKPNYDTNMNYMLRTGINFSTGFVAKFKADTVPKAAHSRLYSLYSEWEQVRYYDGSAWKRVDVTRPPFNEPLTVLELMRHIGTALYPDKDFNHNGLRERKVYKTVNKKKSDIPTKYRSIFSKVLTAGIGERERIVVARSKCSCDIAELTTQQLAKLKNRFIIRGGGYKVDEIYAPEGTEGEVDFKNKKAEDFSEWVKEFSYMQTSYVERDPICRYIKNMLFTHCRYMRGTISKSEFDKKVSSIKKAGGPLPKNEHGLIKISEDRMNGFVKNPRESIAYLWAIRRAIKLVNAELGPARRKKGATGVARSVSLLGHIQAIQTSYTENETVTGARQWFGNFPMFITNDIEAAYKNLLNSGIKYGTKKTGKVTKYVFTPDETQLGLIKNIFKSEYQSQAKPYFESISMRSEKSAKKIKNLSQLVRRVLKHWTDRLRRLANKRKVIEKDMKSLFDKTSSGGGGSRTAASIHASMQTSLKKIYNDKIPDDIKENINKLFTPNKDDTLEITDGTKTAYNTVLKAARIKISEKLCNSRPSLLVCRVKDFLERYQLKEGEVPAKRLQYILMSLSTLKTAEALAQSRLNKREEKAKERRINAAMERYEVINSYRQSEGGTSLTLEQFGNQIEYRSKKPYREIYADIWKSMKKRIKKHKSTPASAAVVQQSGTIIQLGDE